MALGLLLPAGQMQKPPDGKDLFQITQAEPVHLAALVLGNGLNPGPAGAGIFFPLLAGEANDLALWNLDGPFSSRVEKALLATSGMIFSLGASPTANLSSLVWLKTGDELDYWTLVNSAVIRPIAEEFLEKIKDERPIHGPTADDLEASAYVQFVHMANQTSEEAFLTGARKELTYADLMRQPKTYRGDVLEISGRLRRLRALPSPLALQNLGVPTLYEGWVFQEIYGPHPIAFICTQLPQGVHPFEKGNIPVVFQGYFFKKYRYKSANIGAANPWIDSPLMIGRTFQTQPVPLEERVDTDWAKDMLPLFLVFIILVGGAIVAFTVGFLRGDKKVISRIQNRVNPNPFPFTDSANPGNQSLETWSKDEGPSESGQNHPGYRI